MPLNLMENLAVDMQHIIPLTKLSGNP